MKTKITIEDINRILNEIDLEEDNLWNKMTLNKWLRDEHNIIVETQFDSISFGYRIFNPNLVSNHFTDWKFDKWNFEEALEEGLKEALKVLPE